MAARAGRHRTARAPRPFPISPRGAAMAAAPLSAPAPPEGGVYPVTVSPAAGCAGSAVPGTQPPRFPVQSPAQGLGSGPAYVTIPPTLDGTAASDLVSVAAQAV